METLDEMRAGVIAALRAALPTVADIEASPALSAVREALPIVDGRLAPPFELEWDGAQVRALRFEVYDKKSPLAAITARLYRALLQHPACAGIRQLAIGAVACTTEASIHLLGDPLWLLVREGLPPALEHLSLSHDGMVSHGGDLGSVPLNGLAPLHGRLADLQQLEIAGCARLGTLSLPRLRTLRLTSTVSARNLRELARAGLPALETLELSCDLHAEPELRFAAVRMLLRTKGLPALERLELAELDLDEDEHIELDEEGGDPPLWIDMIARSPLVRRLERLSLSFRDEDREAPRLVERAAAFAHLAALEITDGRGDRATLVHPTPESIAAALA
ncbi:MAG: hypothetical protein ACTHU0_18680 [Kofleriaceae bacterium]